MQINGTTGNDTITGTNQDDVINAKAGDDTIYGAGGNDRIDAGSGNDFVETGSGNDTIDAGNGADTIYSGIGADNIQAGADNDFVDSSDGDDTIDAGNGDDTVWSGIGADNIHAGADNDLVYSAEGDDTIDAGMGLDTIYSGAGNDSVFASADNDYIDTDTGNDTIDAGGGDDTVLAGAENDSVDGGANADLIDGGSGNDTLLGGTGDDFLIGTDGSDRLDGGGDDDTLEAGSGNDTVNGDGGNDVAIYTASENVGNIDVYDGGAGIDTLRLNFTLAEWQTSAVQTDIANYLALLSAGGVTYHFNAFDLTASYFEALETTVDGKFGNPPVILAADATGSVTEDASSPELTDSGTITFDDVVLADTHTTHVVADAGNTLGGILIAPITDPATGPGDGTVTWDYTLANAAVQYLAAGQTETEHFTVTIDDSHGGTVSQDVAVTVTGVNDAPVAISSLWATNTRNPIERISVASDGSQGNSDSYYPELSADGRFVVLTSQATNLVAGDTNGAYDAFVHDRQTGLTERLSVNSDGMQGNAISTSPVISADGQFIVLRSRASNLVDGDTNGRQDVFVVSNPLFTDVVGEPAIDLVSVSSAGVLGNADSGDELAISADGRFVAFLSSASNLVGGDTNGYADIFVHDRQTGTTERISVDSDGVQGNGESFHPSISADGRYVTYYSFASGLVAGDTNGYADIFVYDRQTGTTERISVDGDGVQGNSASTVPVISADGRFVAFMSNASNLVGGDTNGARDVFVHDRQTGITERVSVDSSGVQGNADSNDLAISADGRFVTFYSYASNLVAGDTNGTHDVFVHDRQTGITERVSVDSNGVQGNGGSSGPSISADGRLVALHSGASNLIGGDTNGVWDVFVHDRQSGVIVGTLTADDVDHDDNPSSLSYTILSGPSHGTLSQISGPDFTYTPNAGYSGADSFTFIATDSHSAQSNIATVNIEVAGPGVSDPETKIGSAFQQPIEYANASDIATLANGNFVVMWAESDGATYDIRGQIFAPDGTEIGTSFVANELNTQQDIPETIAPLDNGGFVMTWRTSSGGSDHDIWYRVFDSIVPRGVV